MLNKLRLTVLVAVLVSSLIATPALATAQTSQDIKIRSHVVANNQILSEGLQRDKTLRTEILKLVADVRAESNSPRQPAPQIQSPQRNNLSKGTKIAIGVAIAAAIVVVVLVAQRCSNEQGC